MHEETGEILRARIQYEEAMRDVARRAARRLWWARLFARFMRRKA